MKLEGYRFNFPLRVRWAEVDAQNIVFNANYMTYLDCANTEYLRRGIALPNDALELMNVVVAKTTMEFHQSARFDDELKIWCRVVKIGHTSVTFDFAMTRGESEEILVIAQTIYVYVDPSSEKPARVPDVWRDRIRAFEGNPLL